MYIVANNMKPKQGYAFHVLELDWVSSLELTF